MVCGSSTSSIINNNTIITEAPNRRKARIEDRLSSFHYCFTFHGIAFQSQLVFDT